MTNATLPSLTPMLDSKTGVDWLFLFKFNAHSMPGDIADLNKTGIFNGPGIPRPKYDKKSSKFSRHYAYASSINPELQLGKGEDVAGSSLNDPLGATFGQVYLADQAPYFIVWNDQFYSHPIKSRGAPWGHSKGMLVWNDKGEGFVLQVSTPSWPGSGNKAHPRVSDGNTLGFVHDDDISVSQHFFALKLQGDDVAYVLSALHNASVLTNPKLPSIANIGGPPHIKTLANLLGYRQKGTECLNMQLSSGVRLLSKPSMLHVPPWQMVSAELGGIDLRVASWWARPKIYSTTRDHPTPGCWSDSLGTPGAVDIATTGTWAGANGPLGLTGGLGDKHNHAKIGVSTSGDKTYSIFGDMNQQGSLLAANAHSSQNGRGGLFYVMDDPTLFKGVSSLLHGDSAPTSAPAKKAKKKK